MRVVRPDDLLPKGEGRWTTETVPEAFAEAARQLRAHLADPAVRTVIVLVGIPGAGKTTWCAAQPPDDSTVVYDVVNADPKRRAALARRISAAGKVPVAVHLVTPLSLALVRNAERPPWRRVPEAFVRQAAIKLRRDPPKLAEGWARVDVVIGRG